MIKLISFISQIKSRIWTELCRFVPILTNQCKDKFFRKCRRFNCWISFYWLALLFDHKIGATCFLDSILSLRRAIAFRPVLLWKKCAWFQYLLFSHAVFIGPLIGLNLKWLNLENILSIITVCSRRQTSPWVFGTTKKLLSWSRKISDVTSDTSCRPVWLWGQVAMFQNLMEIQEH